MEPNRKRHAAVAATDRWQLLGELLQARRAELGHRYRPSFAAERLPRTPDGNVNVRLVADIENNYRDTYPVVTLRDIARAYGVTYDSMTAVLHGDADLLAPAAAAAGLPDPPITDPARSGSDRAYATRIWQRLLHLAADGITDPGGDLVFPASPADAKTWDGLAGRMSTGDRVWLLADLQRRDAARHPARPQAAPRPA